MVTRPTFENIFMEKNQSNTQKIRNLVNKTQFFMKSKANQTHPHMFLRLATDFRQILYIIFLLFKDDDYHIQQPRFQLTIFINYYLLIFLPFDDLFPRIYKKLSLLFCNFSRLQDQEFRTMLLHITKACSFRSFVAWIWKII